MHSRLAQIWPQGQAPASAYCSEDERLSVLAAHGTSDLVDDPELQRIVDFAARLCAAPIALVSLVERERQAFLARAGLSVLETPRPTSFCAHAMLRAEVMIVTDATSDARFADNPLVTGEPHVRFYAGQPLVSAEGAPLGALCVIDTVPRPQGLTQLQREGLAVLAAAVMRRLSQQRLGEATRSELEQREERLRRMIDTVPGIAFSSDHKGGFDYFNARWQEATGAPPPVTASDWEGFIHPDDFAASRPRWDAAVSALAPYEDRLRLRTAEGSWRWMLVRVVPALSDSEPPRWFGAVIDIDEAHQEAQARELLSKELSHRIKNIFAVVSSLVSLRARGRPEVADFAKELDAAVRALGVAHDYVRPDSGRRGESLASLLSDLLRPYDSSGTRIRVEGDPIDLGARAATPLALIFHELATNSAKYGALAQAGGAVTVRVIAHDDETVGVDWEERLATPLVDAALGAEGFGSRLLRMAIENQLGGQFERVIGPDGLEVRIRVPRQNMTG